MLKRLLVKIVFLISLMLLTGSTSAQDNDGQRRSELGVRQKLVQRKMVELETKLTIIAERLKEKEPERHDRLIKAYQQSKEQLITKKMEEVSDLLDQDRLPEADAKLSEVINNLEALIRLLTNEQDRSLSPQEEERMLEEWKKNIQQQLQAQKTQKQDTQKIANKEETIKNLEAQIKQLEKLVELALSGSLRKSTLQPKEEQLLSERAELESSILETDLKLSKLPTIDEL
jgi:hypothetical protein